MHQSWRKASRLQVDLPSTAREKLSSSLAQSTRCCADDVALCCVTQMMQSAPPRDHARHRCMLQRCMPKAALADHQL